MLISVSCSQKLMQIKQEFRCSGFRRHLLFTSTENHSDNETGSLMSFLVSDEDDCYCLILSEFHFTFMLYVNFWQQSLRKRRSIHDVSNFPTNARLLAIHSVPDILSVTPPVEASINELVRLECNVTGEPDPVITWKRIAPVNTLPSGRLSEHGYVMQFSVKRLKDGGLYECQASNPLGTHRRTIPVNIKRKLFQAQWSGLNASPIHTGSPLCSNDDEPFN